MLTILKEKALKFLDNEETESSIEIFSEVASNLMEDVPGVSFIFKGRKMYLGFKETKFLEKLSLFIGNLQTADLDDFDWNNEEFSSKLLVVIDKIDFKEKINYLSKLFELYAKGEINKNVFFRCCKVLEQSSYFDIESFTDKTYEIGDGEGPLYLSMGLLENALPQKGQPISLGSVGDLSHSEAGKTILRIKS